VTLCAGCMVVPVPHRRLHVYGVRGSVIDAQTRQPLADATVSRSPHGQNDVRTSSDGTFEFKPVHGWHGAIFIGAIPLSLFPSFDIAFAVAEVRVEARGYTTESFYLSTRWPQGITSPDRTTDGRRIIGGDLDGNYLETDPLLLRPVGR